MAARAEKPLAQPLFLLACRKISPKAALGNAGVLLSRSHIGGEFSRGILRERVPGN